MRTQSKVPAIVDAAVVEAIKEGRIEVVAAVAAFDSTGVELAGGGRIEPDAVICATGYRPALEPLVGHLDVLGERGLPKVLAPQAAAPGLRFAGFLFRPGALGYMGKQAGAPPGRSLASFANPGPRSRRGRPTRPARR